MVPDGLAVDDSLPLDIGLLEVDQKGQAQAGGLEIVDALRQVFVGETICAFELDEDAVLDQKVGQVFADTLALIEDWERRLGFHVQAT